MKKMLIVLLICLLPFMAFGSVETHIVDCNELDVANDVNIGGILNLSSLTASQLCATDASLNIASVNDLTVWIAGTPNQVTVTSDGDATVTLALPQDIATGSSPTFAGIHLTDDVNVAGTASSDLITNGDFASDLTGWTAEPYWTWSAGTAAHASGDDDYIYQAISVTSGKLYRLTMAVVETSGSQITFYLGSTKIGAIKVTTSVDMFFIAGATGSIDFKVRATSDWIGTIDNVVVKEYDGDLTVSNGRFVVGTNAPTSLVHIQEATGGDGGANDGDGSLVYIKQDSAWSDVQPWALYVDGYSYFGGVRFYGKANVRNVYQGDVNYGLGFGTQGDKAIVFHQLATQERMRIDVGGNVGIGATSPDTKLQVIGDCKFGDDNTNYTTTDANGKLFFGGDAGLCFGEIYASDNSTATTISTQNVWVQCTIFDTDGQSNNSTPDHTNDHITITKAGMYMVIVSASVFSGAGSAFDGEFEVKKNNGTVDLANVHTDRDLTGGGGDHGSISMTGIADLAVNDTIEVWCRNKTNTTDITFEDVTLSIIQVGGT